ncbi:MAG: hypothetical protein J6K86_05255 [Clostridia bacterium]|nr:hypothetical protein [Clostridia bacterium]
MVNHKETVYLFGDNADNRKICNGKDKRKYVVVEETSLVKLDDKIKGVVASVKASKQRSIVVVNTKDEHKNLAICNGFAMQIDEGSAEEKDLFFKNLRISVFVTADGQNAYGEIVEKAHGCIVCVDKYQHIAMDFIERYPFTKFMNEKQVDYQTSLLRSGVEINVFMLGFGETNKQIFLASIANNQFLCAGEKEPSLKQVNYHIFDDGKVEFDLPYFRAAEKLKSCKREEYLPLPTLPANTQYYSLNAEDKQTLDKIKLFAEKENSVNFVIIACGADEKNIALAKILMERGAKWQAESLIIFVKSKAIRREESGIDGENCFFIGNEEACVFNIEEILGDRIYRMSQLRNAIYDLEYEITNGNLQVTEEYVQKNRENAARSWFTAKSQLERDSSTYGCLSLRSKLNLMGLDYCGKEENTLPALTQEEYLTWYAQGDMPDFATYNLKADGKPIVCYTLDFAESRRKNMAIHEHQRWNSFMLSKGMLPATKKQILEEQTKRNGRLRYTNGKNYAEGRHGNLTTFEGLIEFRQMVAKRDGCSEAEKDVIKYDYQLLDDAYWLLEKSGCKIIRMK